MRRMSLYGGAFALTAMAMSMSFAGEALKSGPQPGKNIPGAFHPLNVTGKSAGMKNCLV